MGQATSLHKAAEGQNLQELQVQVQKYPPAVNAREQSTGWTPLHVAARKGFDPGVRELLARGSRPDTQDKEGRTALHLAAEHGHVQVVQDLLRRGASTGVQDRAGRTPYDYAVQRYPTVAALLSVPPQAARQPSLAARAPPPPQPAVMTAATMPRVSLPADAPATTLLPPAPTLSRPIPISSAPGASSFPRVHHEQVPAEQLLPPAPQRPTALHPEGPAAAAITDPSAPCGYGTAAQLPAPLPYPQPYPHPVGHQASYPQPAPMRLPYPVVPGVPTHTAEGRYDGIGAGDSTAPLAGQQYGMHAQPSPPAPAASPPAAPSVSLLGPEPSLMPGPLHVSTSDGSTAGAVNRVAGGGGTAAGAETTRGSVSSDLDWAPAAAASDWGEEPEAPPAAAPSPAPGRANFNPILSARIQLERLLGAGLQHLTMIAGGGAAGGRAESGEGSGGAASGGDRLAPAASAPSVASAGSSVMSAGSTVICSRTYTYEQLREATGNFSAVNKLGEGGYGPVYRGWLDGIPVAVKVMDTSEGAMQGRSEFEAEVNILSSLHHPHVVLLIGSCPDKGILVYELMPNGSLESQLFGGAGGGSALSWRDRVRIAAEVASALLFLHTAPTPIVHMDLKPANILLDRHLTAKLGDVGLARLAPALARPAGPTAASVRVGCSSAVMDSRLVGTFEFMDPEYMQTAQYSPRSDVFALGMVMLQMLTGQQGKQVIPLVEGERRQPLGFGPCIDPRAGSWPLAEAAAFADLALRCVAYSRQDRPDLRSVILPTLMQLKQRVMLYDTQPQQQQAQVSEREVPPMFLCPITQEVMDEPMVAADGYTYEKLAIMEWISRSRTSPLTNLPLAHTNLVENRTLRSAIAEWRQRQETRQGVQQRQQQQQGAQSARAAGMPPAASAAPPAAARVAVLGGW